MIQVNLWLIPENIQQKATCIIPHILPQKLDQSVWSLRRIVFFFFFGRILIEELLVDLILREFSQCPWRSKKKKTCRVPQGFTNDTMAIPGPIIGMATSGFVWKCWLNPIVPNGFADHYPVFKWLFHWEYTLFSDKPKYGMGDVYDARPHAWRAGRWINRRQFLT